MLNREIPFRPRLEGDFRTRFYSAVSVINDKTKLSSIETLVNREIEWVTNVCTYNLEQRKKYRAIWLLFRDLIHASWKACYRDGILYMSLPTLNSKTVQTSSSPELKKLLRGWMSESRHECLLNNKDFVAFMESSTQTRESISELIADGKELADRLEKINREEISIEEAVKPYLQLVTENARDTFTGHKLSDIWRYFRLTWSTPAETTPGRTMLYLIRDAAHPKHAVMGIASLENCAVQITCRDDNIGWNQPAFIKKLLQLSEEQSKVEFYRLLSYIEDGIGGIKYDEICSKKSVDSPNDEDIQRLLDYAAGYERKRQEQLRGDLADGFDDDKKSDLGRISTDSENALYKRKRADQLARLLIAKKAIIELVNSENYSEQWQIFAKSEAGASAIRSALVAQKTKHIGSSMMELNVCGAIPPYNHILGGKLVALLATSAQMIHDYKERYQNKASEIATRLKGDKVIRPADLVYVGTTSLYYVGSSQYNRLKIPGSVFDNDFDLVWKELGKTIGFGTMHISKETTRGLMDATSDGFYRINHVFGEGASPKMRLLTMSIRELLESTNEDSKDFSKHAMSRIVYGVCLAKNTFEYLMGYDSSPEYYTNIEDYKSATQKTIDFWIHRWLKSRLNYHEIYQRIREFDKTTFLVGNEINHEQRNQLQDLKEVDNMPVTTTELKGIDFIRDFYRGSSAYSDHINSEMLKDIHLETKLDTAILDAAKNGKDIVLTGNPGDGKTHIIRMLKEQLDGMEITVELDASTLSDEEIYQKWQNSQNKGIPFVIAINAAVLYSVYKKHSDFEPIRNAYLQMSRAIVFHGEDTPSDKVIVFDLSKREILTREILQQAIIKLTDPKHYKECTNCPNKTGCDVEKNCGYLNNKLFQERLFLILEKVSLQGYHATLRELQSFIAYLIFGNRSCSSLNKTAGNNEYDITNLIYSGKGQIFKAISNAFDPIKVAHPTWDECILSKAVTEDSWIEGFSLPPEAIAFDNEPGFHLRKRQFYFFNKHGIELLNIMDDDTSRFQDFLNQGDKKLIKNLIKRLNIFFGEITDDKTDELRIWTGHRYDNEPRRILISNGSIRVKELCIGRPSLSSSMSQGIEATNNYIRLEKSDCPSIFLKIDFEMFCLLSEAERGVPVLFMDSDLVKKVWRFVEQLQVYDDIEDDETITLLDVQNKKAVSVEIESEDNTYYIGIINKKRKE